MKERWARLADRAKEVAADPKTGRRSLSGMLGAVCARPLSAQAYDQSGELLASDRTAEVSVWAEDQVLKLDRPAWNGLSSSEASVLATVTAAGIPARRAHEEVLVGITIKLIKWADRWNR